MYVNVFFVIRCLYSTVSLTLVREQHFIRIIIIIIFSYFVTPMPGCVCVCVCVHDTKMLRNNDKHTTASTNILVGALVYSNSPSLS